MALYRACKHSLSSLVYLESRRIAICRINKHFLSQVLSLVADFCRQPLHRPESRQQALPLVAGTSRTLPCRSGLH